MSIMDLADESDGSTKKENIVMEKIKSSFKKAKNEGIANNYIHLNDYGQKREKRGMKKNPQATTDCSTKRNKQADENVRSDSPGLDLSVFQPRGKRKCVIQNESKKAKVDWWSDEEEVGKHEDDGEITNDEDEKSNIRNLPKKKRRNSKLEKKPDENPPSTTVRCYVFSTGMANRAGHAVHKGKYATVTAYHHAQKWATPYLSAEVHCRPFHADIEEQEEARSLLASNCYDLAPIKLEKEEDKPLSADIERSPESIRKCPMTAPRERLLSVDSWQKEQVIQAARSMNRINDTTPEGTKSNSPHHPRHNLYNGGSTSSVKRNGVIKDKSNTDSDSSPQTVPKFTETTYKEPEKVSHASTIFSIAKIATSAEDNSRKKDLNSPPQLVPTFSQDIADSRINSYPADITNLKEQRYSSPKRFHHDPANDRNVRHEFRDGSVRPTVLSMLSERLENDNIRSTLDVAEKALKESRTILPNYSHATPILPRDIHPSLFMSRHSSQLHTSAFNGHIPVSRHHTHAPFLSSKLRNMTSFQPPHSGEHVTNHKAPHIAPFTHRSPNGFQEVGKVGEKLLSPYQLDRPSSLPMLSSVIENHVPKSFSVESLTRMYEKPDKPHELDNGNNQSNEAVNLRMPPRTMADRHFGSSEHLPNRLHIPQNMDLHNGLKRSLDEQLSSHIMEQAHRDKKFFGQLNDERFKQEKERFMLDKERYIHHPRFSFHETWPSSPRMRIPTNFIPRTLSNGTAGSGGQLSPPHHSVYSHVRNLNPFR